MKLMITLLDKKTRTNKGEIMALARRLAKFLKQKGTIEIYLINSARMRFLNKKFRKKDQSANVLSFQTPKGFPGTTLGEVYLSLFYIKKHRENLAFMLVHGVLHILGYDHEKRSDRIKMENKEKELLTKLVASR